MAGQPRSRGASAQRLRTLRPKRRKAQLQIEIRTAHSPSERLTAAFDYFRGALKRRNPDQRLADDLANELTRALIAASDELLKAQAKEPKTPVRRAA